jgi:hypothetical protein
MRVKSDSAGSLTLDAPTHQYREPSPDGRPLQLDAFAVPLVLTSLFAIPTTHRKRHRAEP